MSSIHFDSIRHILFDAVGTLIYPQPNVFKVYKTFGESIGCFVETALIEQRFATAYKQIFETDQLSSATDETIERNRWYLLVQQVFADITVSDQQFQSLWHHFADPQHWSLYPDAEDIITQLCRSKLNICIASNFDSRLRRICKAHRSLAEIKNLFISTELGFSKPNVEFFNTIQSRLNCELHEILLVGDSWRNDIEPARDAGWQVCLIDRSSSNKTSEVPQIASLNELKCASGSGVFFG